jgi:hypothetical protein
MEWPKPVDEFGSDGPITRSLRAAAGEEISLDECVPTGYDLSDSEGVVGRLEEPRAGRPALAYAHDAVWLMQPVGRRWDMAAQNPVSGEVAAYYRGALLRSGGTIELADEREFELRRDWLRPSRWQIARENGEPLARLHSRPPGGNVAGYDVRRRRPRERRIEVSLSADPGIEEQRGLLVLFACYVILTVDTTRGYSPG